MDGLKILLAGAVLLLAAPNALGANIESKERAAKKACLVGDVDKGAEILADLYVDTNDATYIYNSGRCFEQNGKNDQAVLRFKEYLRKAKKLSPSETEAVQKKIEELKGSGGKHEAETPPAPVPTPIPAALPATAPAAAAPISPAISPAAPLVAPADPLGLTQTAPPPEPQEAPPVYKRWWFWTGIGAIVAGGVVTGVVLSKKSAPKSPACDGLGTCVP